MYLAFPEGEARERVLFDLIKQFSKMDPEDPEWLRYKLSVVEEAARSKNVARGLNDAAAEQARLRSVTREIAGLRGHSDEGDHRRGRGNDAGNCVGRCPRGPVSMIPSRERQFSGVTPEETRHQFGGVIRAIIESSSAAQALATSQKQMDGWLKGALDGAIRDAQDAPERRR